MKEAAVSRGRSFGYGIALWAGLVLVVFLSRVAFWPWPQMKLMAAVVFFIAAKYGRKMGVSSAVAGMLASSFVFGWGSWVFGQCLGIVAVAFVGSLFTVRSAPIYAAFASFCAVMLGYGPINDLLSSWMYGADISAIFASLFSGFGFNLIFGLVTAGCVAVFWEVWACFSKDAE